MNKVIFDIKAENSLIKSDISIFFTKDQYLLDQYYAVRERCYRKVKDGPKNFNGQQDNYDLIGDILVITYKDIVIGGVRIVSKTVNNKIKLPLEGDGFNIHTELTNLNLEKKSYCEYGRLAILHPFRCTFLLDKVVEDLVTYSIAKGYSYLFSKSPLYQARCYKQSLQRLDIHNPFLIYKDLKITPKEEDESGSLDMYITSLEFPDTWNGVRNRLTSVYANPYY